MRRVLLKLLGAFALAGCTYGPPIYRGEIQSSALLGDGRVAIGYSQIVSRQPTGISTFPDGGKSKILHDQFLVALVDRGGDTREIARYPNEALPGAGAIHIDWFEADPAHLYVAMTGQLNTNLPLRRLSQVRRIDLDGHEVSRFDLVRELAAQGREFGAKGFGGNRVVDRDGTMLVGATRDGVTEVWRRTPDARWTLLDRFDDNASLVGDDFVYRLGDYQLARNWRTGDVRKLVYFNPATQRSEVLDRSDPAHPSPDYVPRVTANVGDNGTIVINRDNVRIASIVPDRAVLDRR